ncbi:DUF4097 family beta strand repeat-containing protein [Actinoplanes sp. NEAU-A12]|uniref:DUF4097 family beta strand repeat-containing protein n=1 Tax=Actinoplanes sandaracinus TaxID=3045177 RepID=A0ABT6WQ73_9ACTN|nr:DUF4097 family beta strand repeat-containing protein [Actinoplanes sandaracinus]MDI6101891.1 DUF4097 family beta strand repeat-containing protein [Actinoplanes sandaracinus]
MTTVEHTSQQTGPITLHIDTQAADVQVVADPRVTGTWIELSTPDENGPAVTAIQNASFRDHGGDVYLSVKEATGGGTIRNVQFGNGNVRVNGNFSGGVTVVNGVVITNGQMSSGITVRAITEPGSAVDVKTMSGDVLAKNVKSLRAQTQSGDVTAIDVVTVTASTMSGDITAEGVTARSSLKSMSGDIDVSGSPAASVKASTMSGDVTGSGVDLHGSSMSGRVRQRRATAADEW